MTTDTATDDTTPSNDTVTSNATLQAAFPSSGLTLLGTFVTPTSARALLRQAAGHVRQVSPGDKIAGHQVAAIEDGFILLARAGETQRLTLPLR